jgi:hypothetical protein
MTNHPNRSKSKNRMFRVCPRGFSNEITYYRVPADKVAECEAEYAGFADANPRGSARWLGEHEQSTAYAPGVAINWADRNW